VKCLAACTPETGSELYSILRRALINDAEYWNVGGYLCPNFLHKDIALAAIALEKHVYVKKPLALNAE